MCSMLRPRSSSNTRSPFSVSSFAAQPPEMPEPTTIASYSVDCIASSLSCVFREYDVRSLEPRATLADEVGDEPLRFLLTLGEATAQHDVRPTSSLELLTQNSRVLCPSTTQDA